jgi:hypothetical protein
VFCHKEGMTAQEGGRGPICVRIAKVGLWHNPVALVTGQSVRLLG